MTAIWDTVQEFISAVKKGTDDSAVLQALDMLARLISEVHDIDHDMGQIISRRLSYTRYYSDIYEVLRRAKRRG